SVRSRLPAPLACRPPQAADARGAPGAAEPLAGARDREPFGAGLSNSASARGALAAPALEKNRSHNHLAVHNRSGGRARGKPLEDGMIKVENLVKSFGSKVAVNDISFTVERGEVLGFLGPNGAGKSTTMR